MRNLQEKSKTLPEETLEVEQIKKSLKEKGIILIQKEGEYKKEAVKLKYPCPETLLLFYLKEKKTSFWDKLDLFLKIFIGIIFFLPGFLIFLLGFQEPFIFIIYYVLFIVSIFYGERYSFLPLFNPKLAEERFNEKKIQTLFSKLIGIYYTFCDMVNRGYYDFGRIKYIILPFLLWMPLLLIIGEIAFLLVFKSFGIVALLALIIAILERLGEQKILNTVPKRLIPLLNEFKEEARKMKELIKKAEANNIEVLWEPLHKNE